MSNISGSFWRVKSNTLIAPHAAVYVGVAGLGLAALTYYLSKNLQKKSNAAYPKCASHTGHSTVTNKTILINKPRKELYDFWCDFKNFPKFMENVESVETNGKYSTWKIKAPAGQTVNIESELIESIQDERLCWRSTAHSEIESSGEIHFRDGPSGRGTYVEAYIAYKPPAGQLGRLVAKIFRREPEIQARYELKRFKMLMETGEIATSERTHSRETEDVL